jgi:hypothetical protein
MNRLRIALFLFVYCAVFWLIMDAVYSAIEGSDPEPKSLARTYSPQFHHGLLPNFDGWEPFFNGYRITTNSRGFRDRERREIPDVGSTRRILVIGDSFTEAVGSTFEESFFGLLQAAGMARSDKVEFLNAGGASYSPTLYYRKIKSLLESGLRFDEVIVFSDLSDVPDEAWAYFCFDDIERYRAHCDPTSLPAPAANSRALPAPIMASMTPSVRAVWESFKMTQRLRRMITWQVQWHTGWTKHRITHDPNAYWTIPGANVDAMFQPLGIEGGAARSIAHMQMLADLLRARDIPLSIAVYPWAVQLAHDDRDSRQVKMWRDFCTSNCKQFINLFPAFFAHRDQYRDWFERLFIHGDWHYSPEGNRLMFTEAERQLFGKTAP